MQGTFRCNQIILVYNNFHITQSNVITTHYSNSKLYYVCVLYFNSANKKEPFKGTEMGDYNRGGGGGGSYAVHTIVAALDFKIFLNQRERDD